MKKYLMFFLLAGLVITISSCGKRNCCDIPSPQYYMSGRFDDQAITLAAGQPVSKNDTITVGAWAGERGFYLSLKKNADGFYALAGAKSIRTVGLDVRVAEYTLTPDQTNAFSITTSNDVAEGTFNLSLTATYNYNNGYPTTLKFTNGKFKVKLK